MAHDLQFLSETDTDVLFACSVCGAEIGFNKPGIGEPCPGPDGQGGWVPPDNPDQWMPTCAST